MRSFVQYNPTRMFFGPEHADAFARAVSALGKRALVVIAGGSVQRLGYLQSVLQAFAKRSMVVEVFEGIESNPNAPTVDRAAEAGRKFKAEIVVPVGGGSTMDAAKAIAALIHTGEAHIWPFVAGQPKAGRLTGALPVAAVPTTAATASEVTEYAVISNYELREKSVLAHEFFKPEVAWINPAFTLGVSATTTADGAADILSHVLENYLLGGDGSPLADGYTESVIRTVLDSLPKALAAPEGYEHRARLMWASTLALNGYQLAGRDGAEFVLHSMEHALSGFKSDLAHGRGLATLYPSYFRWLYEGNRARNRLAQLGRAVFKVHDANDDAAALKFIERFENWLRENRLYQSLASLGFDPAQYEAIADYCVKVYGAPGTHTLQALGNLGVPEIVAIFEGTDRQV